MLLLRENNTTHCDTRTTWDNQPNQNISKQQQSCDEMDEAKKTQSAVPYKVYENKFDNQKMKCVGCMHKLRK